MKKIAAAVLRATGQAAPADAQQAAPAPVACAVTATPQPALQLQANLPDPDGFYEELISSQRDLSDEEAERFQARLLLVLANHVGDRQVLRAAMKVARGETAAHAPNP